MLARCVDRVLEIERGDWMSDPIEANDMAI